MARQSLCVVAAVAAGLLGAAAGCSVGPAVLQGNRAAYNAAAQRSANEQLLLNLVRLKYREPMLFLRIGSISSHFNVSANASLSGTWPDASPDSYAAGAGASYSEQPTLTYTTLEGEEFANRILTETDMGTFTLLVRGGWNIEDLMRIMVERIGPLRNYPSESAGPQATSYEKFMELVGIWKGLQRGGDLSFLRAPGQTVVVAENIPPEQVDLSAQMAADQKGYSLVRDARGSYRLTRTGPPSLVVRVQYAGKEQADRADALLGIRPQRTKTPDGRIAERIRLVASHEYRREEGGPRDEVPIQLRSYSDLLYYVAQGIEVPAAHEGQGLTKVYRDLGGRPVQRRKFTRDLLDVRCSTGRPADAFVAVRYRNHWFYIADSDPASKDAFALLSIVFALQSEEQPAMPLLTIPVAG